MSPRQQAVTAEADPGRKGRHPEADALECGGEKRVLLEAVPAPTPLDQLGLEAIQVDPDRAAQEDIEVLERDRRGVCLMDSIEDLGRRGKRAGIADAGEVGSEIERGGLCGRHGEFLRTNATKGAPGSGRALGSAGLIGGVRTHSAHHRSRLHAGP